MTPYRGEPVLLSSEFTIHVDERGSFQRLYSKEEIGYELAEFVHCQTNLSRSRLAFTLRGLHYQKSPFSEHKLISCIAGRILDVCVDVRENSKTFGKTFAFELSSTSHQILSVPVGFAHGFQTLEDNTSVIYFVDQAHKMSHEQSVRYDSIGFDWPHSPAAISEKDKHAPTLHQLRASGQLGV